MSFPRLQGERLDIDCLRSKEGSYSIDSEPGESVAQRYLDGSTVRRFLFTISGRMYYGSDIANQAENLAFFEELEAWLSKRELLLDLPDLGEKRTARSLEVLSSAYQIVVDEEKGSARYQIQMRLTYLQEV
ncbi:MAG: hypothetical protein ACI3VQ_08815 [Faecousia sp.]